MLVTHYKKIYDFEYTFEYNLSLKLYSFDYNFKDRILKTETH